VIGKPRRAKEEQKLRELVKSGANIDKIAAPLDKSESSVRAKIRRLKLKLEEEN